MPECLQVNDPPPHSPTEQMAGLALMGSGVWMGWWVLDWQFRKPMANQ